MLLKNDKDLELFFSLIFFWHIQFDISAMFWSKTGAIIKISLHSSLKTILTGFNFVAKLILQ